METQFVPYELAVKLKELGFNEKCLGNYEIMPTGSDSSDIVLNLDKPCTNPVMVLCDAPLWQQSFVFVMDILTVQPGYYQTHIIYISNNMMTVKTDTGRQTGKQFHSRKKCLEYLLSLICK